MSIILAPVSVPMFVLKQDEKSADTDILAVIAEFINTGPHRMFKDDAGAWKIEGYLFSASLNALPMVDLNGNDMIEETRRSQKGIDFVHLNGTTIRFGTFTPCFTFDLNLPDSLDSIGKVFECKGWPKVDPIQLIVMMMGIN